jgi:BirA family biotin operon repressor/biotin-[acetyl-CoA-carboxylase] ligase
MTALTWDVHRFATLSSTNDWVLERARGGTRAGLVAVADHQRAGKGRLGRRWEAPFGRCLLVSVLLRPVAPVGELFASTAAMALAASDACTGVAGVTPAVKWPNDLLLGERKVAGVLAEADPSAPGGPPGSVAVVVGIGVNLDWDGPPGSGATSLAAHASHPIAPSVLQEELLAALLAQLGSRVAMLEHPETRRAIVAELRTRCATLGREVVVETARGGRLLGTARALGDDGRLVVATADGEVTVSAGDVVHLRPLVPGPR